MTTFKNVADNAVSTTATNLLATGVVSITLATGTGASFPTAPFFVTIWSGAAGSDPAADANMEKVTCSAKSGDVLTISATAKTHSGTVNVGNLEVAQQFTDLQAAVNTLENGVTAIVQNETPGGLVNGSNTVFTTASNYATNSLKVYLNGQRLTAGGADYTVGTGGFTMAYAPATGDVLLVDYNVSSASLSVGTNSTVSSEAPTGLINSVNTSFTLARAYIAGSLEVYVNGVHQVRGTDYAETTPGSGIFTLTSAPLTGQSVTCNYQYNLNPSSNSDTVDGVHASTTLGQDGLLVPDYGGWRLAAGTYTFSTATVMNTPSDMTGWLAVGDKIRWKQGGSYKYGYVIAISTTQITLVANTDYTIANATITDVYFSKVLSPAGFPQWFNYAHAVVGFSSTTIAGARFSLVGRTVHLFASFSGTSNSTGFSFSAPITSAAGLGGSAYWSAALVVAQNNSASLTADGRVYLTGSSSTVNLGLAPNNDTWTATGTKAGNVSLTYEI